MLFLCLVLHAGFFSVFEVDPVPFLLGFIPTSPHVLEHFTNAWISTLNVTALETPLPSGSSNYSIAYHKYSDHYSAADVIFKKSSGESDFSSVVRDVKLELD